MFDNSHIERPDLEAPGGADPEVDDGFWEVDDGSAWEEDDGSVYGDLGPTGEEG